MQRAHARVHVCRMYGECCTTVNMLLCLLWVLEWLPSVQHLAKPCVVHRGDQGGR